MSHFSEAVHSKLQDIRLDFFKREPSVFTDSEIKQSLKKGIVLLSDFLSEPLPSAVAIRTAAEKIKSAPQRFIDYYEYYSKPAELPSDARDDETLGELTDRFIREYRERLEFKNRFLESKPDGRYLSPDTIEENNRTINIFSKQYDKRIEEEYSRKELGTIYKTSGERIRQIAEIQIIAPCKSIFEGSESDDRVVAETPLLQKYASISDAIIKAEPLHIFKSRTGADNSKTVEFLADILGLEIYKSSRYFESFVLARGNITQINKNEGSVIKFFRDKVRPVSASKVRNELKQICPDNEELQKTLFCLIDKSDSFEKSEILQERYYSLKWQYLEYLPNEVVRILHDANRSMHKDELLVEYNKLARQFNKPELTEDNFNFGRHKLLVANGKTGCWNLKNDDDASQKKDVRDEIRDYVCSQGGKVMLDDVYAHISELGYTQKSSSVKTYLAAICLSVIDEPQIYVYEDWAGHFPDLRLSSRQWNAPEAVKMIVETLSSKPNYRMPVPDLVRELNVKSGRNVTPTTLENYLKRANGLFIMNTPEELNITIPGRGQGRTRIVTLNVGVADGYDYDGVGKTAEPAYRQLIRNQAIEELRSVKGNTMPLSDLTKKVKTLVPDDIKPNAVYKILGDDSLFTKKGDGRNRQISLNVEKFKTEETASYKFAIETTEAPQALNEKLEVDTSNQTFDWAMLRDEIVFQTKSIFAPFDFDIEKAANDMYDLMAGNKGLMRSSVWWQMLNMLNNYWLHKTAQYERELLSNSLMLRFEKLLVDGYIRKYDENPRIYDAVNGLGGMVKLLREKSILPGFDMHSRDSMQSKILFILSKVVKTRNDYAHASNDDRTSEREINENIMNCLILYLYVAKQYAKVN